MLTEKQGGKLVNYARDVIESYVCEEEMPEKPDEEFLERKRGVFVTLRKDGDLKGCIGLPEPQVPLNIAVRDAAISATQDRRFPPLEPEEVEDLDVEVTVMSKPERIDVDRPEDYLDKIKVGKHGLVIEKGVRSGLLLPQVPEEQGWDCKQYLQGLCEKAGLPTDAWKEKSVTIKCFKGKVFGEEK